MTKRRIRALRAEWKLTHQGQEPEAARREWGLKRFWTKIGGRKREVDFGVGLGIISRSRRRRMKKKHQRPGPKGRRLERLKAMAIQAFRPKKRTRERPRHERQRRRWVRGEPDRQTKEGLAERRRLNHEDQGRR